ncbi:hypothetical protein, partial [Bradyrhizobium sp.]|uniref:hypothetical protein n=1 Tax=Bradyrhizobium sp. TaxID=376 RepID=UPI003C20EE3A
LVFRGIRSVIARLDRATQYAAASRLIANPLEYWVTRSSRVMTNVRGDAAAALPHRDPPPHP